MWPFDLFKPDVNLKGGEVFVNPKTVNQNRNRSRINRLRMELKRNPNNNEAIKELRRRELIEELQTIDEED